MYVVLTTFLLSLSLPHLHIRQLAGASPVGLEYGHSGRCEMIDDGDDGGVGEGTMRGSASKKLFLMAVVGILSLFLSFSL